MAGQPKPRQSTGSGAAPVGAVDAESSLTHWAATLPVEGEEMSPEDLEAAIEAELGGRGSR